MKKFEMPENSPGDSVRQPLGPSGFKGDDVPLSEHNNVNDHQKDKYNGCPCSLRNPGDCKRKLVVSPCQTKEIKVCNSSSKASGHGLQFNPQSSFPTANNVESANNMSGSEESARSNNVKDSGFRSNTSFLVAGFEDLGDEMILKTPDSRFTEDDSGQKHGISYTDEDAKGDQNNTHLSRQAGKSNKALHSSNGFCNAGTKGKNNAGACEQSISKHTNFYGKKARRIYETRFSWNKKDKSSIASPESLSLNRSRSGWSSYRYQRPASQ